MTAVQIRLGTRNLDIQPRGECLSLNNDTQPIWFETKLFVGRMVVRVKDAENAPQTGYFDTNKRLFSCQVSFLVPLWKRSFARH